MKGLGTKRLAMFAVLAAGFALSHCSGDDATGGGAGGIAGMGGHSGGSGGATRDGASDAALEGGGIDASVEAGPLPEGGSGGMTDAAAEHVEPGDASPGDVLDAASEPVDAGSEATTIDASPEIGSTPDAATDQPVVMPSSDASDAPPETATPEPQPDVVATDVVAAVEASLEATAPDAAPGDAESIDAVADRSVAEAGDGGVTFAQVAAFFSAPVQHCTNCHNAANAAARIDLSSTDAQALYARLTSTLPDAFEGACGGGAVDGGNRTPIEPGSLEGSFLWLKITGTQPAGCGQRMPRGCNPDLDAAANRCLGDSDTQVIRDWILEGAPGP